MPQYFNHPMLYGTVFFGVAVIITMQGCAKDEDPVKEIKPDAAVATAIDMGLAIPLPVAITDIFRYIPDAPEGIHARSGDAAKTLLTHPQSQTGQRFQTVAPRDESQRSVSSSTVPADGG